MLLSRFAHFLNEAFFEWLIHDASGAMANDKLPIYNNLLHVWALPDRVCGVNAALVWVLSKHFQVCPQRCGHSGAAVCESFACWNGLPEGMPPIEHVLSESAQRLFLRFPGFLK